MISKSKGFPFQKMNELFVIHMGGTQAQNELRLVAERPSAGEVRRYKSARQKSALYRASTLLWQAGVPMGNAISIVESAMRDAGEIP